MAHDFLFPSSFYCSHRIMVINSVFILKSTFVYVKMNTLMVELLNVYAKK